MSDALAIQEGKTEKTQAFQDPKFRGSWSGYERDSLFFNAQGPKFFDAGHAFDLDFDDDGRAAATVDVDGDGDLDLALLSLQGLRLMENKSPARRFARVKLEAAKGDPQAIGAQVVLKAGGATQRDFVKATSGFATQCLLELHFGLGAAEKIDEIEIKWRDGSVETHRDMPSNKRIVIKQGSAPRVEEIPKWSAPPRVAGRVKGPPGVKKDGDSTLVFDAEGRLRRAFHRPVTDEEVAATVNHLGKGTFHADLTAVATYHLSRHEFEPAHGALKRAIEMNPSFPIAHYYLGMMFGMQNRHAEAAESFRRAVELDAHYRTARVNLGAALLHAKRLPEAAQELRAALELGDDAETRHMLGSVLASQGQLDGALVEVRKSIELNPKRAEAHLDLGKILMVKGQKDEAIASLKKALELDPRLTEAQDLLRKLTDK